MSSSQDEVAALREENQRLRNDLDNLKMEHALEVDELRSKITSLQKYLELQERKESVSSSNKQTAPPAAGQQHKELLAAIASTEAALTKKIDALPPQLATYRVAPSTNCLECERLRELLDRKTRAMDRLQQETFRLARDNVSLTTPRPSGGVGLGQCPTNNTFTTTSVSSSAHAATSPSLARAAFASSCDRQQPSVSPARNGATTATATAPAVMSPSATRYGAPTATAHADSLYPSSPNIANDDSGSPMLRAASGMSRTSSVASSLAYPPPVVDSPPSPHLHTAPPPSQQQQRPPQQQSAPTFRMTLAPNPHKPGEIIMTPRV